MKKVLSDYTFIYEESVVGLHFLQRKYNYIIFCSIFRGKYSCCNEEKLFYFIQKMPTEFSDGILGCPACMRDIFIL